MSFRLKIILGVSALQTFVLVVLAISATSYFRSSHEQQLMQRSELTLQLLSQMISGATTSSSLHRQIQQANTLPDIVYIRVSTDDHVLAEVGPEEHLRNVHISRDPSHALAQNTVIRNGVLHRQHAITNNQHLATLYLGISAASFEQARQDINIRVIVGTSAGVLLAILIAAIFGHYLVKRIQGITHALEHIHHNGPGIQLADTSQDELSRLSQALNALSTRLMDNDSELKRALRFAKSGEAKHQAILGASLDAIVTIDRQGLIIHCNDATTDMTGWPAQELLHKPVTRALLPEFTDHLHELASMRSLPQRSRDRGLRLNSYALTWDGSQIPVEIALSSIPGESGQLIVVYLRDITERRQHETELRLAAHAFESTEAIFITNAKGDIIRVNQAFTHITGYSPDEVIGRDPGILAAGEHDESFFQLMKTALEQEGKWQGEIYNQRKNGEIYPEHLNISTVRDEEGHITHFVAHSVDISSQKANERHLHQARLAAEQASAAKSRFLATMSHEIRTPLNGVMGILGILKSSHINHEQLEYINTANASAEHLLTVINDILDYSRMEAGKLKLEPVLVKLQPLLEQVHGMMLPLAENHQLSLRLSIAPDVPDCLTTDPERLKQILLNLLSNAIKFTPTGDILLSLQMQTYEEQQCVCFAVEDTGIGIDSQYLDGLFDEFSMIDQSTSRRQEGSGLGLAICKRLTHLMHGHLGVDSQPGVGSRFWFLLPVLTIANHDHTDSGADTATPAPSAEPQLTQSSNTVSTSDTIAATAAVSATDTAPAIKNTASSNSGAYHFSENIDILLAEDNPANQLVIKTLLTKAGLNVDIAHNGAEASEMVTQKPYDLVLMDISMPVVDGLQATANIRALPAPLNQIPIIAVTAHALGGDKERFLEQGMDDYLTKPVNRTKMLTCIEQWLEKSPRQTTSTSSTHDVTDENDLIQSDSDFSNQMETNSMTGIPDIDNAPVIDFTVLEQLAEDTSPELVPELIELYSGDAAHRIERIEQSIITNDIDILSFEVHTIGSSAGAHGNMQLFKISREIERLCQEKYFEEAFELARFFPAIAHVSIEQLVEHRKTLI